jgi:hypothetical protein
VFGVRDTHPADAAYFDAPPPACPPIGGVAPRFAQEFRLGVVRPCVCYTTGGSRALALCSDTGTFEAEEGAIDSALSPATIDLPPSTYLGSVKLFPDGDRFIALLATFTAEYSLVIYRRDGARWVLDTTIMLPPDMVINGVSRPSTPTRDGHRFLMLQGTGVVELVETAPSVWVKHACCDAIGLVSLYDPPNLTPDGLRIVFATQGGGPDDGTKYADRNDVSEQFAPAKSIAGFPQLNYAFMTEDCDKLYFSATQLAVFYVPQAPP